MAPTAPSFKHLGGYNRTAQKIMWFGVFALSLIIIVLWGWAFTLQISLINIAKSPEGTLIKKTKTDWDQAFATNKTKINQKETAKQEIETILNQIITTTAAATTTQTNSSTLFQKP